MRQEIVDLITSALSQITITNGYLTDAGMNVSQWAFLDESNPKPVVQVRDVLCSPLPGTDYVNARGSRTAWLELKIIYVATEGVTQPGLAPATLRKLLRDVLTAVGAIDYPDYVNNVMWGGDEQGGQQESKKYVGIVITLLIDYQAFPYWTD
jgi:hypothetical protein